MKDIIYYNYNIDIESIDEYKDHARFIYDGYTYYLVFFNRNLNELDDIIVVNYELKRMGLRVPDIIYNKDNKALTKINDTEYLLLKLNSLEEEIISLQTICNLNKRLIVNNRSNRLLRNNWAYLWSTKVDYFEYQIKEIGKDKMIVLDSFSYYIGLAENAISYTNKINKIIPNDNSPLVLAHRRIFYPNIALNFYNPLSYIVDVEVRDIAEYLKINFFNNEDSLNDLSTYLKTNPLSKYNYHMLYARLLYPSYYFDLYEKIMNNDVFEEKLIKIIEKSTDYEKFLKDAYKEISKYTNLEMISWIMK